MTQESFTLSFSTGLKLLLFFSESRRLLQVVWKIRRGETEVSLGDNICQVSALTTTRMRMSTFSVLIVVCFEENKSGEEVPLSSNDLPSVCQKIALDLVQAS